MFRALFEIVGLDGYEGREVSIVDSVNFWWVLMQPLHRALARLGTVGGDALSVGGSLSVSVAELRDRHETSFARAMGYPGA